MGTLIVIRREHEEYGTFLWELVGDYFHISVKIDCGPVPIHWVANNFNPPMPPNQQSDWLNFKSSEDGTIFRAEWVFSRESVSNPGRYFRDMSEWLAGEIYVCQCEIERQESERWFEEKEAAEAYYDRYLAGEYKDVCP